MRSQIESVFYCVSNYINEKYDEFVSGETNAHELLTLNDKTLITQMLVELAQAQQMPIGGKKRTYDLNDTKEIKRYCRGLLSNHLRRDSRLNGGLQRHELNEQKRGPNGDAQLKALQALAKQIGSNDDIEAAIVERKIVIEAQRKRTIVAIDINSLPAHLQHLAIVESDDNADMLEDQ